MSIKPIVVVDLCFDKLTYIGKYKITIYNRKLFLRYFL